MVNFNDEVYFLGADINGNRPDTDELALGFVLHWNGGRNDNAVRNVLNSSGSLTGDDLTASLYRRYRTEQAAGRNANAEVIADAIAVVHFRKVFADARLRGDNMDRPHFDNGRRDALGTAASSQNNQRVGSSQIQAINEDPQMTMTAFVERGQSVTGPDTERRRAVTAVLNHFYNDINNDSNSNNDISLGQARANIENAKRRGDTEYSSRALDDAIRILTAQERIEQRDRSAAPVATRERGERVIAQTSLNEALTEILGTSGNGLMNPAHGADIPNLRRDVTAFVRANANIMNVPQPERDAFYRRLLDTFRNGANTHEKMVAGYALDVFSRANERGNAHRNNVDITPLNRETFLRKTESYMEYAEDPAAWHRAHPDRPASAAAAAPAASGGGAAPGGGGAGGGGNRPRGGSRGPSTSTTSDLQLYRCGNEDAPPQSEIPVLAQNQVRSLQRKMVAAGIEFTKGADGLYGPNTHRALKTFAASLQPPINDLTQVDFTANGGQGDEEAQRILQALQQRAQQRGGQPAPAAGAGAEPAAAPAANAELEQSQQAAARAVAATTSTDQTAKDNRVPIVAGDDAAVREAFISGLREAGVTPTAEQLRNITVTNGVIHSPDIQRLEAALNGLRGSAAALTEDGNWDDRLAAILRSEGLGVFIGSVFNATDVAGAAAPGGTPGGTAPTGRGQGG